MSRPGKIWSQKTEVEKSWNSEVVVPKISFSEIFFFGDFLHPQNAENMAV